MPSQVNLRKVVEWGMDTGHSVLEIAEGLDLDYLVVGTMYMAIKSERHGLSRKAALTERLPAVKGHKGPKAHLIESAALENERAFKDPRYANWLRAKRGAGATLRGKP